MVGRHERQMIDNAVIVDLDGTLVCGNTFKQYLRFILNTAVNKCDFSTLLTLLYFMLLRATRIVSHAWLKRKVLLTAARHNDEMTLSPFIDKLLTDTNDIVVNEISELQSAGHPVYLATAAPMIYARLIAEATSMTGVVATPSPTKDSNNDWREIRGAYKLKAIKDILSGTGQTIWRSYTDHIDDLPLIANSLECVLVTPNPRTLNTLKLTGIDFRLIDTTK